MLLGRVWKVRVPSPLSQFLSKENACEVGMREANVKGSVAA